MSVITEQIKKKLDEAWLNLPEGLNEEALYNPLENIPAEFSDAPHLYILFLLQQPNYFSFVCEQILNVKLLPIQCLILREMWNHKFPMLIASRGFGKSFLLAVYCLLRMLLMPGRRIVVAGAAFRQSKVIFGYMETIWRNAPILRDLFPLNENNNGPKREPDMYRFHMGDSITLAIPVGDGSTIRGLRAHDIIADEFASITREVFEVVIQGFAAVRSDPISGVQYEAAKKMAVRLGIDLEEIIDDDLEARENQIIIAGTAYYDFNHFAEYFKKRHKIISSLGDLSLISDVLSDDENNEAFNWKHYCIIRIPYNLIPKGFMDDGIVLSAKANSHIGLFQMEYGACFAKDSYGFFKRSLIESCVPSPNNTIELGSGVVSFVASLTGDPYYKYVYGIDTASEADRFAIVILELHSDHRRIKYAWSTNRKEFKEKMKLKLVRETDYYGYCARKIRDLMFDFPCERIMMDSQGGGIAVLEALHDKDKIQSDKGEKPLLPVIVEGEPKESDGEPGLHIVEMVNFASAEWTSEANHTMKKDMEDKMLLFPYFDTVSLEIAGIEDEEDKRIFDTREDMLMEIEELKNELSTIVISQTSNGRDKWDTPEIKLPGNKKGRLRKDRYSALLMANMGARILQLRPPKKMVISDDGGFAKKMDYSKVSYSGPVWATKALEDAYN